MPYRVIKDFKRGLDGRRMLDTTEPGALFKAINCHVTRGGELEKRKAFTLTYNMPAGTFGLWVQDRAPKVTVFGSKARPPLLSTEVNYQRLQVTGLNMTDVLAVDNFYDKLYVAAKFSDGKSYHFYDGTLIPLASMQGGKASSFVRFYVNDVQVASSLDHLYIVDPSLPELAGNPLGEGQENGIDLFSAPVSIVSGDAAAMHQAIADEINATTTTPNFTAKVTYTLDDQVGEVYIEADAPDDALNGAQVAPDAAVNGLVTAGSLGGGADSQGGYNPGEFVLTYKYKVYSVSGSVLHFSALGNPRLTTPDATGAGFIDMSTHQKGPQDVVSLTEYQGLMAVFARKAVQIWNMDPDPEQNFQVQALMNTGTFAARSVLAYGTGEVFYLDTTGIRSLRARDSSNAAYSSDVGNAIDEIVTDWMATLDQDTLERARAVMDPVDGRMLLSIGDRIFVFSFFAGSKISAWTEYQPGFTVDEMEANSQAIWVRSGDNLYRYGGLSGEEYDASVAEIQLPYDDTGKPATEKYLQGLDMSCEGDWQVRVALDPTDPRIDDKVADVGSSTYRMQRIAMNGGGTHISLKFKTTGSGYARLGRATYHFQEGEAA